MNKPRLVLTRRLPQQAEAELAVHFDLLGNPEDRVLEASEIVARAHAHQAEALLVTLTERLEATTIDALPASVRIICTYSVGTNHLDLQAARRRGIALAYAPQAVTEATADTAMLLLLAACRRAHEFQAQLRQGRWGAWNAWENLGWDPGGQILGLVGMGRIGRAVARRARAFGMDIHYFQRNRLESSLEDGATYHSSLDSLFAISRFVSLHTPTTPETKGFINAQALSWLKDGAIFLNTARGDQVDDDALIAALRSGKLAAAGLDVFNNEPAFDRRYLDLPNAYLLPHIGTSTEQTRIRMSRDCIANLCAFFAGKPIPWPI
ncbi:Glycerate dehydrogenase [Magnetospirillum gryphiswaldense MSR-1 v2]|uniref:Glycerate dehydrogenase n=1 Tax=Magnetospirillum gryphiswaldense (strain DSM 6361 / JCM 21280 / NBRC 15271 / MSR-1) TaxID=431944 RepID=V6EY96_MAGGM|nr:D-glycerate dehydrogenase [Magnetospirillum gryphiswaldense]CDK98169.1 Glycerate dehydrogenase [Magnetospirillum gryphiswaldense MSR-1 v2]